MRSFEPLARCAAAALSMLVLGGCGQGATPCTAVPGVFNNAPALVIPSLVSPAPGATGVSTGPLDVTIGNAIDATGLFVRDGSGNLINATNFREANPPAADVRVGTFAQLAPRTTYQVYATLAGSILPPTSCTPTPVTGLAPQLLGSFTTG